ncbi:bidirectional sugar transporter SWEET14-like [Phalaenopsis equestris]|uniref:bidirectional sugar transporter SWEET14-like n=1 Tax=Phalaenopsis equestris TaxID=78828 RepID=UPI0009E265BB|nr:bidirectional sugar transporter SWEET14-like [Phalaenopsis equestris]
MSHGPWALTAGILGNVISFMVFLAPISTFYRIYKKRSTEGFQAVPYVVALFSAMLWLYYAVIKTNVMLLIIINSIGCIIETIYLAIFLAYAHKKARVYAAKLILLLDGGVFSLIVLSTVVFSEGDTRVKIVGWICVAFAVGVFAAPLSIMKLVIATKSVEFMPFNLSFFLTLCAVAWFSYGLLIKDLYVMLPNVLGFMFGVAQMILYQAYKKQSEGKKKDKVAGMKNKTIKEEAIEKEKEICYEEWTNKVKQNKENDMVPV